MWSHMGVEPMYEVDRKFNSLILVWKVNDILYSLFYYFLFFIFVLLIRFQLKMSPFVIPRHKASASLASPHEPALIRLQRELMFVYRHELETSF